jgi:hypothetical protein
VRLAHEYDSQCFMSVVSIKNKIFQRSLFIMTFNTVLCNFERMECPVNSKMCIGVEYDVGGKEKKSIPQLQVTCRTIFNIFAVKGDDMPEARKMEELV